MTTYYVGSGGSDAAAGTSYATRWLTVAKALGATGATSGDTVYITPGTYLEAITVNATPASLLTVIGDVDGSHTSGVGGEVHISAYTSGETSTVSNSTTLNLNGKSNLSFSNITFEGGNATPNCLTFGTTTGSNITFTNCGFFELRGIQKIAMTTTAGTNHNILIDRCLMIGTGANASDQNILITVNRHTVDYNIGVTIQNCVLVGGGSARGSIQVLSTGAGAGFAGGLIVKNCTIQGIGSGVSAGDANLSTSIPIVVSGCFIWGSGGGVAANTSGQITEDHNVFSVATPRTNVSVGTGSNSAVDHSPRVELGQSLIVGRQIRPFFSPLPVSTLLGYGTPTSGALTTDLTGRPRPEGGQSILPAAGAYECHDTAAQETSTTQSGSSAIKIVGPGSQRIYVAVNGAPTVISIYVQYDNNHAATNKPQAILRANGPLGVATETKTATVAAGSWEQLTFSSFTPSGKGVVIIDLISRSAAGSGIAYFDTLAVS